MNARTLGLAVALAIGFVLGVWLTQLFLENTAPTGNNTHVRPSIVTVNQQRDEPTLSPVTTPTEQDKTTGRKNNHNSETDRQPKKTIRHWWTGLAGKQCHVTLGETSSLRIRQGSLTDGSLVNWDESFGKNRQIGTLFNEADNTVFVHGVGIDARGLPIAAQITHTLDGSEVTGIISLSANDLQVSLYPVDDKNQTP